MTALSTSALLTEIVKLGEELLLRPIADIAARRERCDELLEQLREELSTGVVGPARHLDNFAPILLRAIRATLKRQAVNDRAGEADWLSLVGFLIARVRQDGGRALDEAKCT